VSGDFVFSPDGRWLVTQHTNQEVRLWELPAQTNVARWSAPPFADAFFERSNEIVTLEIGDSNSPPALRRLRIAPPSLISNVSLAGIAAPCTAAVFIRDGQTCVTGHTDGTIGFWDWRTSRLRLSRKPPPSATHARPLAPVVRLVPSLDGRILLAHSFEVLYLTSWSLTDQSQLGEQYLPARYDLAVAVAPDGSQIALGGIGLGLSINFWTPSLKESATKLDGHQDFLDVIAYSPDGRTLATGAHDGQLKLWHLPTGREIGNLATFEHTVRFRQLAFSDDGSWLGASVKDGTMHLWQAPQAEPSVKP